MIGQDSVEISMTGRTNFPPPDYLLKARPRANEKSTLVWRGFQAELGMKSQNSGRARCVGNDLREWDISRREDLRLMRRSTDRAR